MKRLHLYFLLGTIAVGFLLPSFKFDIDESSVSPNDPEIQAAVQERIQAFKRKKEKECLAELMDEVDAKVDTILMFGGNDFLEQENVIIIPEKPGRPGQPEIIKPEDNTPLQPLIDEDTVFQDLDSLEVDTLLEFFEEPQEK